MNNDIGAERRQLKRQVADVNSLLRNPCCSRTSHIFLRVFFRILSGKSVETPEAGRLGREIYN